MLNIRAIKFAIFVLGINAGYAFSEDKPAPPCRFTDLSEEVGLAEPFRGAFNHAVAWGDYDNDGRPDLFFGTFAERSPRFGMKRAPVNMLLRQTVNGKFERVASDAVDVPMRCGGAMFVDLDNDGKLDLYVAANRVESTIPDEWKRAAKVQGSKLYRNDASKFVDVSEKSGACPLDLLRCRDVGVLDFDNDGLLDLLIMQDRGATAEDKIPGLRLFRNRGNFKFEDVTKKAGLAGELWGTGIAIADLNGDKLPDVYICGINRLYLCQKDSTFKEAESLRPVFNQPEKELDWVCGASFGDLNGDGRLDLITGRHHYFGPSRVHVYLNEGVRDGVPMFREITKELGIPALPQKAPHPEIQDFDNDGIPDLYWSVYFTEGKSRQPFICKGLGVKDGLPRFSIPSVDGIKLITSKDGKVQNEAPAVGRGMVYYVASPAVDYNGDGKLDFCCGIWPDEPSRLFRNDTPSGNWLQVRVEGKKMNRMGVGAQVRIYAAGKAGDKLAMLGYQEITVNGGYSSGRPAVVHFGLGEAKTCDVEITLPSRSESVIVRDAKVNRSIVVQEP
ncbi:MAG: CRTAC1 family protein [Planctomycetes bacterium]|nr:CRTAC1 family protein [Planctomycetota bacterium]